MSQRLRREIAPHRPNTPTHDGSGRVRSCRGDEVARRVRRRPASGLSVGLVEPVPGDPACRRRGPNASGRGKRIAAHPPSSVHRGPDSERIRAFFVSGFNRPTPRRGPRSMDRTTGDGGCSLTSCRKATFGTGRRIALQLCGCSSAGRARPRHGRGHEFEARHPLHFGCVHALRGRVTWC